jgi:hypothetical protein
MTGKRLGGLWSAAGTVASGRSDAVRLAFLLILLESAGLPTQYEHARFTIWAKENGYLGAVVGRDRPAAAPDRPREPRHATARAR